MASLCHQSSHDIQPGQCGGLYLAPHIPGGLRWSPGAFFFGWEHSQIGMHNPPGFHQDSRWTPDEPHGVSGVDLPDSSVNSTWTQSRVNPSGVQEESVWFRIYITLLLIVIIQVRKKVTDPRIEPKTLGISPVI